MNDENSNKQVNVYPKSINFRDDFMIKLIKKLTAMGHPKEAVEMFIYDLEYAYRIHIIMELK